MNLSLSLSAATASAAARFYLTLVICAIMAILLLFATTGYQFSTGQFTVHQVERGSNKKITLPFLEKSWSKGTYVFKGEMTTGWLGPRTFQIIPDDELKRLTVNGVDVDLKRARGNLKDVYRGVVLDLSDHLQKGPNQLEVEIEDIGGDVGLRFYITASDPRLVSLVCAWLLLGVFVFLYFLRRLGTTRQHSILYLAIVLGLLQRVWIIFTHNPMQHLWSDPLRHWEQGTDLFRLDLMALTDPIGYQMYIALLAKLTLKNPTLVAFYTSVLSVITPWIWYRFFRELTTNKTIALAGCAVVATLPSWTSIYSYFMQETLMLPLLGAALWASWRARRTATVHSFLIMVFLWVAVGLTRGIAIPMAAVVCTWLWWVQPFKFKKALYSSLVLLLVMGPLTYRSFYTVNHFAPHGMGYLNILYAQSGKKVIQVASRRNGGSWVHGFGSPSTGAKPFAPLSDWKTRRTGVFYASVDLMKGKEDWNKAREKIDMTWKDYFWITGENLIFLFFAESWPDNNAARPVELANSVMRWIWAPIAIFIIITMIVDRRLLRHQWMLPSMMLAWFVVQALVPISVNEGRYRKPFEGLAIAYIVLWCGARRREMRFGAPGEPWGESFRHAKTVYAKLVEAKKE